MRGALAALALLTAMTGCAGLPEAGPGTGAVEHGGQAAGYDLVTLNFGNIPPAPPAAQLAGETAGGISNFADLPPGKQEGGIAPGDELQVTLWEANPQGTTLLTPPGLETSLRVDPSGIVLVPYVGALRAAGETPLSLQRRIGAVLQGQGHEIQAAVLDVQPGGDTVILAGDAARPGAYPLTPATARLTDLIAEAGGPREAPAQVMVRLQRGAVRASAPLTEILADPALDAPLAPGDEVTLLPRHLVFYAFGAVNHPGMFSYDRADIPLIEALAEVSGLSDERAAPRGVFIYRGGAAQSIYQLDLSQPQGFFIASRFILAPGDVIYVSDAPVADLAKVLQTITGLSSIAAVPRNFGAPY